MVLQRPSTRPETIESLYAEIIEQDDREDMLDRASRNPEIPDPYFRLLYGLIRLHPELLKNQEVRLRVAELRKAAGNAKERTTGLFLADMAAIGALVYDSGPYRNGDRIGTITPIPDKFDAPEEFKLRDLTRRRTKKEAEAKAQKQFKNPRKLHMCEECGSDDLLFDVSCHCRACGHVHAPVVDIPPQEITIEAEIVEIDDDQAHDDQAPTTPRLPAVAPGRQLVTTEPPLIQISLDQAEWKPSPRSVPSSSPELTMHPRGIACPVCGHLASWTARRTYWGGIMYWCANCSAPEDLAEFELP